LLTRRNGLSHGDVRRKTKNCGGGCVKLHEPAAADNAPIPDLHII